MDWNILSKSESQGVLDKVRSADDPMFFSGSMTEVQCAELPFYNKFLLYRVTNYATMPSFTMEYVGDGNTFYVLDGTPDPIYFANKQSPLELNKRNLGAYLDFFFHNVGGPDGDVYLISDPDKAPFMSSLDESQKNRIREKFIPLKVNYQAASAKFIVDCTLYYNGSLVSATISVEADGRLKMMEHNMLLPDITPNYYAAVAG